MDQERRPRCPRCTQPADRDSAPGYCLEHHTVWQTERTRVVLWARWVLRARNVVLLATETTFRGFTADVHDITLLSPQGRVRFDALVRPLGTIPPTTTATHGLDTPAVRQASTWVEIHGRIAALLRGRDVVAYNAPIQRRRLDATNTRSRLPALRPAGWHCAMEAYATFTGVWNSETAAYTRHALVGGDYTARGDCLATLDTIRWMAESD